MAQSQFNKQKASGFTLAEVMVALTVLAIGLLSVAALFATTIKGTAQTEYMTQAATLATEKLEDLSHYSSVDPHVAVTTGTSAGSITADTNASVTSNGNTLGIYYFDEVFFSPTQGTVSESISQVNASGTLQYTTTTNQPNGIVPPSTTATRATLISGAIYFKRRWVIEQNQPIAGLRRITVWVSLENLSIAPNVQFQMSIIRP
jgi:prepilin-type N-terminal cleavage/methylation domain-containing protein